MLSLTAYAEERSEERGEKRSEKIGEKHVEKTGMILSVRISRAMGRNFPALFNYAGVLTLASEIERAY